MSTARHSPCPLPLCSRWSLVFFLRGRYQEEGSFSLSPSRFFSSPPPLTSSSRLFFHSSFPAYLFLSLVLSPLIVLERVHHDCPVNHGANRSPWRRYPPTNEDLFREQLVETREYRHGNRPSRVRPVSLIMPKTTGWNAGLSCWTRWLLVLNPSLSSTCRRVWSKLSGCLLNFRRDD